MNIWVVHYSRTQTSAHLADVAADVLLAAGNRVCRSAVVAQPELPYPLWLALSFIPNLPSPVAVKPPTLAPLHGCVLATPKWTLNCPPVTGFLKRWADRLPPTDYSLGIDEPDTVAERARRVAHFPALKIKVGGPSDLETLEAVRAVFDGPLRVDANTGWEPEQAAALIPELERLGVELVEQPFRARMLPQLRWLRERSSLPIMADESAVSVEDLPMLEGVVDGIVVKLAKVGGIGPALRQIRLARELGMKVMLGCMVESSVGVAAAAMVASEVDWLDLDGNLLLADDPFEGLILDEECRWRLPDAPGLGVRRKV